MSKTYDPEKFQSNYEEFLSQKQSHKGKEYLTKIQDNKLTEFQLADLKLDFVYAYQDTLAFELFSSLVGGNDITEFLDVGSKLSSMLFFARLAKCFYLEVKNPPWSHMTEPFLNIKLIKGEGQGIEADDERFKLVTSLHAIEHFGLGRYGDEIDFQGDFKALQEFNRVLSPGGHLILSVPYSFNNPRIWFHGERVYSKKIIFEMLSDAGFKINQEYFIAPHISFKPFKNEIDCGDGISAILISAEKV